MLAGLDRVDTVFTEFAAALDVTIRSGRSCMLTKRWNIIGTDIFPVDIRQKAVEVALSLVSGAYQTSLLSYFIHRDLFPPLMKVCTMSLQDGHAE